MTWDGTERRQSMFDKVFYDKLMETHVDVKTLIRDFDKHLREDQSQFKTIKGRIFWLTIGVVVIGMLVGGPDLIASFIK